LGVGLLEDESGVGVLEYGVMLALVAMVVIAALLVMGGNSNNTLSNTAGSFPSGNPGVGP
jgi:pilus assembly protein Flp/PilA